MAISDLTGTSWTLQDSLIAYAGGSYSQKTYSVNITTSAPITDQWTPSQTRSSFSTITIGYDSGSEQNIVRLDINDGVYYLAIGHDTKSLPDPWQSSYFTGTFTITGGADATNSALIAWIEANCEAPPVPDISVTYEGAEIASLSDSGTKTLKTAGKYCDDDITIDYTKSGGGGVETVHVTINGIVLETYYTDATMTVKSAEPDMSTGFLYIDDDLPVGTLVICSGGSLPSSSALEFVVAAGGRPMSYVYKVVSS